MSLKAEEVVVGIIDLVLSMINTKRPIEDYEKSKDELVKSLDKFIDERASEIVDERIRENSWRWEKEE